jgi:hypothetical protein
MRIEQRTIEIDWNDYANVYPDRYLNHSPFDARVKAEIESRPQADVLDIGGGREGTQYLRHARLRCWLLDPYIKGHPDWMVGNIGWETAAHMRFDCIVARGCFNYLAPREIQAIPSMLKEKGCLMFNTFYKPRSGLRKYKNSRTGTEGVERFQYFPDKRIIEHELEPHGQSHVIRHTILVYRLDEIIEMLGPDRLRFEFLGYNSLFVSLHRGVVS